MIMLLYSFGLFLVGMIWGVTNVFIEYNVKKYDEDTNSTKKILRVLSNTSVLFPYLIN